MTGAQLALRHMLAASARKRGDRIAMSDGTRRMTWADVAERVDSLSQGRLPAKPTIGLIGENGCDWAIAFLAALLAGKTVVPLPSFFSAGQLAHIIRASDITDVIAVGATVPAAPMPGVSIHGLDALETGLVRIPTNKLTSAGVLVFTSGSTGRPKGIHHSLANLLNTADALTDAVGITDADSYLSVLPLPMLLEQICAILIPLKTAASVTFDNASAERIVSGQTATIADSIAAARPTILVLVPQLLAMLCAEVQRGGRERIDSLRVVAVGGAAAPPILVNAARELGLPVFEGYGLTECCSVVALNTPDHGRRGTVGRPLPGMAVEIVDGEIVVTSKSVMIGYLGGGPLQISRWKTGDLGTLDADGFLQVIGRKDNLIIRSNGRNVSPEWIEAVILETPGVATSVVCGLEDGDGLGSVVIGEWHDRDPDAVLARLEAHLADRLPAYAIPKWLVPISIAQAVDLGVLRGFNPDRAAARAYLASVFATHDQ